MAFVEAVQTAEELALVPRRVQGPCLLNIVPGGKTPLITLQEAQTLGYRLAILPGLLLGAMMVAGDQALRAVKESGVSPSAARGATVMDTFRRFGADEWNALRQRFATKD
jgi:2-methylisocitrate lyase-like PEP mutase family enzyme